MKAIIFLVLSLLVFQCLAAENVLSRRKMQAKTDTGTTAAANNSGTFKMRIFGSTWSLTWDKWIWSALFIGVGLPMCFLTISWWKLFRLPMGGLVGFFVCNALEVYAIMPYVNPNEEVLHEMIKLVWLASYIVCITLGILLFWCCPKVSIGGTCATLLWMFGLQFNGWLYLMFGSSISPVIYLLVGVCWAVAGFFLGCFLPNFTIMIGTACGGAFLSVVGVGIMTEQYPGNDVLYVKQSFTWWIYFTTQIIFSVCGFCLQHFNGYKKNGFRVDGAEAGHISS